MEAYAKGSHELTLSYKLGTSPMAKNGRGRKFASKDSISQYFRKSFRECRRSEESMEEIRIRL